MFQDFDPKKAKAMKDNYKSHSKDTYGSQKFRLGQYADGGIILEGDPPLVVLKEESGESYTPGTTSVFHPRRGWIPIKEI